MAAFAAGSAFLHGLLHFLFGHSAITIGVKAGDHAFTVLLARHFVNGQAAVLVGVQTLQHFLAACRLTLGLPGLGGCGQFLGAQRPVAICVDLGEFGGAVGVDLFLCDLAVAIGVDVGKCKHRSARRHAFATLTLSGTMCHCCPCKHCKTGDKSGRRDQCAFHSVLSLTSMKFRKRLSLPPSEVSYGRGRRLRRGIAKKVITDA
jgi:hypothetical protein